MRSQHPWYINIKSLNSKPDMMVHCTSTVQQEIHERRGSMYSAKLHEL